jgi:AcrB/AcrD/AcrF family
MAQIPASVKMELLADRSVSIRDSVEDVKVTLAIAIALVVLVIFLFLRSAAATVIPALAVPISLIATFAAMYQDFDNRLQVPARTLLFSEGPGDPTYADANMDRLFRAAGRGFMLNTTADLSSKRPGWLRCNSSRIVVPRKCGCAASIGTISLSHTSANGSTRVRRDGPPARWLGSPGALS